MSVKKFNAQIHKLELEAPTTNYAIFINKLSETFNTKDYYRIIDNLSTELGFTMGNKGYLNKNDKVIGYIPRITYKDNNIFGEKVAFEDFNYFDKVLTLNESYELLAQEIIFKLSKVKNFFELTKNKPI